jgi:hypothetical protein
MIGQMIVWTIGRMIGRMIGWMIGRMIHRMLITLFFFSACFLRF